MNLKIENENQRFHVLRENIDVLNDNLLNNRAVETFDLDDLNQRDRLLCSDDDDEADEDENNDVGVGGAIEVANQFSGEYQFTTNEAGDREYLFENIKISNKLVDKIKKWNRIYKDISYDAPFCKEVLFAVFGAQMLASNLELDKEKLKFTKR